MNPLPVDILVKASALLAAAGLADLLLGRRGSAAARCLVWSLAIGGLLVLPIASYALPHWPVRIPIARGALASTTHAGAVAPADFTPAPVAFASSPAIADAPATAEDRSGGSSTATPIAAAGLGALYAAGVLILLVRFGREPFVLRRLTRASREIDDPEWRRLLDEAGRHARVGRPVRLRQSAGELMPMTYGTWRPTLLLPASADMWTDDRRRAVLLHELAHVARRDCFVQRLASIACALYWPHPGVWWAARRLRTERELACDDLVLAAGAAPREYAGHLLDLARSLGAVQAPAAALGMTRARHLEHRLLAVLDAARNRTALRRGGLAVAIAGSIAVLLPVAALRAAVVPADRPSASGPLPAPSSGEALQRASPAQASTSAMQTSAGVWEIRLSPDAGSVYLNLRTLHGSHGTTVPLARLDGLTASQISAHGGAVHFTSRRDAGTLVFDGVCRNGLCGGTYGFEPNPAFAAQLAKRGIGAPTAAQQYALALANVGIAFLDELSTQGYEKPDLAGLLRAADHGVDLDYIRDMAGLGYRLGTVTALIQLRDHGVDPGYVRGMAALGFSRLTSDELTRARDHGVDPEYIKGMRDLGYGPADLARLVTLRDHGVDPEYARGMAALGFKDLPLDTLVTARDHGVDPEYARALATLGYAGLTLDTLVKARDHGVDPEYIRGLAALGYKAVPLDALIRMRDHGVDPDYVRRLQQRGSGRLSVDQLIQRRDRGDGNPDAALREMAASFRTAWNRVVDRVAARIGRAARVARLRG